MAPEATGKSRRGSVTLVALCMTTALGIALGSYIGLCSRSVQFSTRQLQQDRVRELAQVGLEEALWALNQDTWTTSGPAGNQTWTTSGANRTVTLTYPLDGQGATAQVALTIANYASSGPTWPTITSAVTLTRTGGETFTRTVQAAARPAPLFGNAIASADSYVSFSAGGTVDSWNSDPDNNSATAMVAYSFTAGNASNYEAVIAGRTNGNYGVVLTQATLRGYVSTFGLPVSYSTSGSPPAKVLGPSTSGLVNVDTTRIGKSAFIPMTDVFSVTLPSLNVTTYTLLQLVLNLLGGVLNLPAGVDTCKINGNLKIDPHLIINPNPNITIDKPVQMIVDGNFTIEGDGVLTIKPTGSLQLFVTGDVTIGGKGIDNQTNDPKKLAIFCTSTSTDTLEYTTNEDFCGVIFAEHKPIDIRQNATFYGALLSRRFVRFTATAPVFHYDSSLRQTRFSAVTTPYVLRQVTEL
jgi:hypothetical protein